MSWKPQVLLPGDGWSNNALVFATKEEAEACAADTYRRWTLAKESRAIESDHPVNYAWVDGKAISLKKLNEVS
jgi:hypothetical protein